MEDAEARRGEARRGSLVGGGRGSGGLSADQGLYGSFDIT